MKYKFTFEVSFRQGVFTSYQEADTLPEALGLFMGHLPKADLPPVLTIRKVEERGWVDTDMGRLDALVVPPDQPKGM